jgi:hypothetical protein
LKWVENLKLIEQFNFAEFSVTLPLTFPFLGILETQLLFVDNAPKN